MQDVRVVFMAPLTDKATEGKILLLNGMDTVFESSHLYHERLSKLLRNRFFFRKKIEAGWTCTLKDSIASTQSDTLFRLATKGMEEIANEAFSLMNTQGDDAIEKGMNFIQQNFFRAPTLVLSASNKIVYNETSADEAINQINHLMATIPSGQDLLLLRRGLDLCQLQEMKDVISKIKDLSSKEYLVMIDKRDWPNIEHIGDDISLLGNNPCLLLTIKSTSPNLSVKIELLNPLSCFSYMDL